MGIAVCGSLRGWGVVVGRLQGGGLQCGRVAVWAGCSVVWLQRERVAVARVEVWGHYRVEELWRGELRVLGSSGVGQLRCEGVAVWGICSVC